MITNTIWGAPYQVYTLEYKTLQNPILIFKVPILGTYCALHALSPEGAEESTRSICGPTCRCALIVLDL